MSVDKYMKWANDKLLQAQALSLRGSVTIHFNNGVPVSGEIKMNDKPSLDEKL